MKRNILKAFVALSLLGTIPVANSCRDALDIEQPGVLTDDVLFTSVTNLNDYLIGSVYGPLEPFYASYVTAVLTDEVKPGRGSGGQEFQLHRFFLDSSDRYTSLIWQNNYLVINRVNRLLEGAKKVTPAAGEMQQYKRVLAQAKAVRAFCYLQLQTYFAPNMADPNGLGAVLLTDVPASNVQKARATNKEVFDLMEADLDFARQNLTAGTDRFYVDKRVVNAIAARMNLYRGDYAKAKMYAQDLVFNYGLTLTPTASYRAMWQDTAAGEIIFALNRLPSGNGISIGTFWNTNSSSLSGNPMWVWGRNLFNIMNETPGDIRRSVFVDPTALIDPNYMTSSNPRNTDVLVIDKYPGKTNAATRNDEKIFRLSEMYFILAECAAQEGNFAAAAGYIAAVRTARGVTTATPVYTTKQEALRDILKERRVELSLEGHRYIDLKRLATAAGVTMDRNKTDDDVAVSNLPNDSYKYTLPIPLAEKTANPLIQQNPGY